MAKIENSQCAKCGACTVVCPVFQATGRESLSARGRLHLLERLDPAQASIAYAEILSQCLLCGACRSVCSRGLDPPARFLAGRKRLARSAGRRVLLRAIAGKALGNPAMLATIASLGHVLLARLPADSGLRLRLGLPTEEAPPSPTLPETPEVKAAQPPSVTNHGVSPQKSNNYGTSGHRVPQVATSGLAMRTFVREPDRSPQDVVPCDRLAPSASALTFFPGCYATHLHREIGEAAERIAARFTGNRPEKPQEQGCCGLAAENGGDSATARRLARRNISAFAGNSLPILTSCSSCYHQLRRYPELLADDPEWQAKARAFAGRLLEFSTFVAQAMAAEPAFSMAPLPTPRTVVYHDPCHLRFAANPITAAPREILRAVPGLNLAELVNGPQCCGQGGLFHLAQPELAGKIRSRLLGQLAQAAPDLLTTTCSGCLIHIQQGLGHDPAQPEVRHLAILLADLL